MINTVADRIRSKLTQALSPQYLEIADESFRHAGHSGARPEGETHFHVEIIAETFRGLSRIDRQRLVHRTLAEELAGPVHALSLTIRAPGEERR